MSEGAILQRAELERLAGGAPRVALEDILEHGHLKDARRLYLRRFLGVYGNDPSLARLLVERGRFLVYMLTVVLEAAQDPARRETWSTVGRLKQKMALFGVASERRIDHLVTRFCALGYMKVRSCDDDRRVRILLPTSRLKAHDRDWLAAHYAPLSVLYPQHDYGPALRRDRQFQMHHRRACVPFLPLAAKLLLSVPDMMLFFAHAAGHMILAALLHAAMGEGEDPLAAVPYAEVGERFGVSRTHVRQLLVAAQTAGLVKLHARGGHRVEILPRLWSSYDRAIAGGMYLNDMLYVAATRSTTRPVPEPAPSSA